MNLSFLSAFGRYVRSVLGWLLMVLVILLIALVFVLDADIDPIAKYIFLGVFALVLIGLVIFVAKRTPKEPHGLLASEDYYVFLKELEFLQSYGVQNRRRTRKEAIETSDKAGREKDVPAPPQLPKGKGL